MQVDNLISMSDIARMANVGRAAVSNWRTRFQVDFPEMKEQGRQGPLYDRAEVIAWLESKGKLESSDEGSSAMWKLLDLLSGELEVADALTSLFTIAALRVLAPDNELWKSSGSLSADEITLKLQSMSAMTIDDIDTPRLRLNYPPSFTQSVAFIAGLDTNAARSLAKAILVELPRSSRGFGQFTTPQIIRDLLVGLTNPSGDVYVPVVGSGQLMVEAASSSDGPFRVFGQEINGEMTTLARLNLRLHDVDAVVKLNDGLSKDCFPNLRADVAIADIPFHMLLDESQRRSNDIRWQWGVPGRHDSIGAWIQDLLFHLSGTGRAAVLVAPGFLFRTTQSEMQIRRGLISSGVLDGVIALPPGLLHLTRIPAAIVLLRKSRPAGSPIWMLDLSADVITLDRHTSVLSDEVVERSISSYTAWRTDQQLEGRAVVVDIETLAQNGFDLSPSRYTETFDAEIPNEESLVQQLSELLEASQRLSSLLITGAKGAK
jgi:hypothetical protein